MRYLLLIFLLFYIHISVCAQQIIARQMPFFHDLLSNEIWDIYQDKEGYIWIGTTNGLARYDGYKLQSFRSDHQSPGLLTNNSIVCMSDNDYFVWIGTRNGLNLFNKKTYRITPFPDKKLQNKSIDGILIDKDKNTWIATERKIYICDQAANIIKEHVIDSDINSIYKDKNNDIWILSNPEGLYKYDITTGSLIKYPPIGEQNIPFIMYQDKDNNYWIGTWGEGLWQFVPDATDRQYYKKHTIINIRSGDPEPIFFSITQDDTFGYLWLLSYNELYALKINEKGFPENIDIHDILDTHMMYTRIYKDRNGNLWLSSYDMPYTIFFDRSEIKNYPVNQLKENLGWDTNLLNMCLDKNNIMWIYQDRYGLCLYDLSKDKLSHNNISIYSDLLKTTRIIRSHIKDGIWIANKNPSGIMRLTNHDMKIRIDENIRLDDYINKSGEIRQLEEDDQGNLWILTSTHLFIKPLNKQLLIKENNIIPEMSFMVIDKKEQALVVTSNLKIYRFNYENNTIHSELISDINIFPSNDQINHICVDKENNLWIISSLGKIYKSDKDKYIFEDFILEKEIENSSVLNLLSDEDNIWIITNKKIIQYDIDKKTIDNYTTSDENILVNVFRNKAACPDGKGGLYAGGHGGFTHIPSSGNKSSSISKTYLPTITDIKVDNKSILFAEYPDNKKQINTIEKIVLNSNDRNIEISFSSNEYRLNSGNKLAYKLDGVDKDWIYLEQNKNSAFYNQLNKGNYRFWVKSEIEDGKWSDGKALLIINKQPALYETWYAYCTYFLFICALIYLSLRIYKRNLEIKNNIRIKEELNRTKLDYFTNVSHEILTPLTIISCSVDNFHAKNILEQKESIILKSNTEKLKRLIQQILDFRKIDLGKMKLSVSYGNIDQYINNICETSFLPLARKKNIDLEIFIHKNDISGYLDFDKLDKILYNLLSNAIKYTDEYKYIKLSVQIICKAAYNFLEIKIEDEGIGIDPKEIDRIFSRFYTNKNNRGVDSNGIGLSLTKDLVALHHGSIFVKSIPGKGSCFTVELPIDKDYYTTDELTGEITSNEQNNKNNADEEQSLNSNMDQTTILVVDDNTELLYLIKEIFKKKYNVITANNGKNAWEKLNNYETDIVICDVMMPDENGWELCLRIKADLQFNHIPVIILTAKSEIDDRVASYKAGADGYISKPFEPEVLFARIDNLIRSYKTRNLTFQKEQNIDLGGLSYHPADKKFLQSIIDSIELHLDESEFDLERLSSELNISKSTLHRKIKSITGLTPLDLVRNIKMKRACMMLTAKTLTISEIAYSVGYNNPKYFTKCFKEEFGMTPSEYQHTKSVN